ncbi:alpha/beta hydrolase [Neobacillus novalis]|uniref:Alpha/beta hydrolase n=1 Tax=Neobacillus novalis TaxID=220687 RepID=A0AA95MKU7_9BACI|nr:alpha/beta hydrolase [Neobacillus novalis]WHY85792.1 alpha/beta hydrolase [Neobacillus novalis]
MSISEERDFKRISYGCNENQFGDLRLPVAGDGPFPVAIVIHGGFWRAGFSLDHMNPFAESLTAQGIATWSIEYRRVGQEGGGWPGTFQDVSEAVDFVRTLSENDPLDLNRVVTIGHSAGGHLALWAAARHRLPQDSILSRLENPLSIKGVISLSGVSDLALMCEVHYQREIIMKADDNPTRDLIGGNNKDFPSRFAECSPIELLPIGIPLEIIHGSLDINVPVGISEKFAKAAESAGDDVALKVLPNSEHFKLINPETEEWAVVLESTLSLINKD